MTGRELIIYILENKLEDREVFDQHNLLGFMSEEEAALKFGVGSATIRVWVARGYLQGIRLNDVVYIPADSKNVIERIKFMEAFNV